MLSRYSPVIAAQLRALYQSLSEKDRRRYAAIEVGKLDRGGLSYIANVLGCDRHTIAQGLPELADPHALRHTRVRQEGGGRQPSPARLPGWDAALLQVLAAHTAGSPRRADVKWTHLTQQEMADRLAADHGIAVSVTVVKRLLEPHDLVRRKAQKRQRTGECAHRAAPLAHIARLTEEYTTRGAPSVSSDTQKKS
jgi:Rhodopirellula transposase DDE domain